MVQVSERPQRLGLARTLNNTCLESSRRGHRAGCSSGATGQIRTGRCRRVFLSRPCRRPCLGRTSVLVPRLPPQAPVPASANVAGQKLELCDETSAGVHEWSAEVRSRENVDTVSVSKLQEPHAGIPGMRPIERWIEARQIELHTP